MTFRSADGPITDVRAKLGGQPVWLDRPQWPLSRNDGEQMMFIGQFPIPGDAERIAHLFMTDDRDGLSATWEVEDGENALIVQPGGRVPAFIETVESATGPSLWKRGPEWSDGPPVELRIDLVQLDTEAERWLELKADYCEAERKGLTPEFPEETTLVPLSYVGGRPVLWQPYLPLPVPDDWRFFFQLDGFDGWDQPALNFGGGTGYAFLSPDGLEGRFAWDCV